MDQLQKNEPWIGEEYVNQVRTFGALGYSIDRIAKLLSLSRVQKAALLIRLGIADDPYAIAYANGRAIGEYNIDAELAKQAEKGDISSIEMLEQRKNARIELDLRKELFGV